ncbi:unnamed protein product, partial [Didymodactylos carnosus]
LDVLAGALPNAPARTSRFFRWAIFAWV